MRRVRPRGLIVALLLAAACKDGPDAPESPRLDDTAPDDTASDDTADDTGDDTAVEPSRTSGTAVVRRAVPAPGTLTVGWVSLRFSGGPAVGPTLASAPLADDLTFALELPARPPDADLGSLGRDPTPQGALYALLVFDDTDADGVFQQGEPVAGGTLSRYLAWLEGDGGRGWPTGWSLVDLGASGQYAPNRCWLDSTEPLLWRQGEGYPRFETPDAPLAPVLRGLEAPLALGGAVSPLPEGVDAVVALPLVVRDGGERSPALDAPLEDGRFAAPLSDPAPAVHDVGADPDWRYAAYLLLPYTDLGEPGYGDGDPLEGSTACRDGQRVLARFTRPVSSYRGFRLLECYDGVVGWSAATSDPDSGAPVFLADDEAADLVVDTEACREDG